MPCGHRGWPGVAFHGPASSFSRLTSLAVACNRRSLAPRLAPRSGDPGYSSERRSDYPVMRSGYQEPWTSDRRLIPPVSLASVTGPPTQGHRQIAGASNRHRDLGPLRPAGRSEARLAQAPDDPVQVPPAKLRKDRFPPEDLPAGHRRPERVPFVCQSLRRGALARVRIRACPGGRRRARKWLVRRVGVRGAGRPRWIQFVPRLPSRARYLCSGRLLAGGRRWPADAREPLWHVGVAERVNAP